MMTTVPHPNVYNGSDHIVNELNMFNMMLDNPYIGIIYVDEKSIIRYVNSVFAEYNRKTRADLIGSPFKKFKLESNLQQALENKKFEPLLFVEFGPRKFMVSRWPVYRDKHYAGILSLYFSISVLDVEQTWGSDYLNLIAAIQAKDIMANISQTILALDSYRDEFNRSNVARLGINNIIGSSSKMDDLKRRVLLLGLTPSSVLITGESGTGKELFAQAIHYHGKRSENPFVKVNCAAIPENLLESELFGYVDGAFTGAKKGGKMGKFELANNGTIFLDEIGDMPPSMQAKLLRVLQEREIERLGDAKTIPINVRVIAATNKDLLARDSDFREDLYYRLNVVNLHIPPLRERKEDLHDLVNYAIQELNKHLGLSIIRTSPSAMSLLVAHDWPGNVRELKNVIEGAMNFCHGSIIDDEVINLFLHKRVQKVIKPSVDSNKNLHESIDAMAREQIINVLEQCKGSRKNAAKILNLSKSTLYRLMKKHNLLDIPDQSKN